jgi:hypothetical protein
LKSSIRFIRAVYLYFLFDSISFYDFGIFSYLICYWFQCFFCFFFFPFLSSSILALSWLAFVHLCQFYIFFQIHKYTEILLDAELFTWLPSFYNVMDTNVPQNYVVVDKAHLLMHRLLL